MGGGTDLWVLGLAATIWWLPALFIVRDMDRIPGLPRAFFWLLLPIVGMPIAGPAVYWLLMRRWLVDLGQKAAKQRGDVNRARRQRGATTDDEAKRPRPSGGKRRKRR